MTAVAEYVDGRFEPLALNALHEATGAAADSGAVTLVFNAPRSGS